MTIKLNSFGGGGSPYLVPPLPTPITGFDFIPTADDSIAHKGTLINNVSLPSGSTLFIDGKLGDSVVWSVDPEALDASNPPQWLGLATASWYDSINDRFYVFALDTSTTPDTLYLGYITLETGAVTQIGNTQLSVDMTSPATEGQSLVQRSSIDSGNFTIQTRNSVIVINESTGAEISNVPAIDPGTSIGTYSSIDGSLFLDKFRLTASISTSAILQNRVRTVVGMAPGSAGDEGSSATVLVQAWGDEVRLHSSLANKAFFRGFNRADFDTWLAEVALLGGL